MSDRPDPDERDIRDDVKPPLCCECDFRILDEPPILGTYGFVHAKCVGGASV